MPPNKKSKKDINNSPSNSIPTKKPETSKSSNNSIRSTKPSETLKREKFMTSMAPKELRVPQVKRISSTCSSEEEEAAEVVNPHVNKFPNANPLKSLSMSVLRIFTMAKLSKFKIRGPDAAKNVAVREDKMSKNAKPAREKVWSFKCIKWVRECINKFKNIVISAKVKAKLSLKVENVRNVKDKRFFRKQKPLRFQLKKVSHKTTQLRFQEKVTNFLIPWLET
jgi:hypothetical protein